MENYAKYLKIWDLIHTLNTAKIFDYGIATYGNGGAIIEFENDNQKNKYCEIFK